jgi:mannonate dehydratase
VQQGVPGRDEQIENYLRTIQSLGRAGVSTLGYNFTATYVWRTSSGPLGRGGALVTGFDVAHAQKNVLADYKLVPPEVRDGLDAATMWANHQYFLDAAIPVAEEHGVRLCLHPDDPPVDKPLGGAARIFVTPASLVAAYEASGRSPAWGLTFCIGTVSEMGGQDAVDSVIDSLGRQKAIAYIHLRDVAGTVPVFVETFLGAGNLDIALTLRKLREVDFEGYIIDDHVPALTGDKGTWEDVSSEAYCSRGRAHALGYLQGILAAL